MSCLGKFERSGIGEKQTLHSGRYQSAGAAGLFSFSTVHMTSYTPLWRRLFFAILLGFLRVPCYVLPTELRKYLAYGSLNLASFWVW
jgi:hypothetical protein